MTDLRVPMIKICGLSTPDAVDAACNGGATHLGFIFFPKSPRNVSPAKAANLAIKKGTARSVAVSVNANDEFLDEIVQTMSPDMLQLHGSEDPGRVAEVKARYGLPVIKALSIRDQNDLTKSLIYDDVADMLLLDAKPPANSELPGGNGVSFDWSLVENLQSRPVAMLSGGIDLDNIEAALSCASSGNNNLRGLDVSSGVESAPGVKDIQKITSFMASCRYD